MDDITKGTDIHNTRTRYPDRPEMVRLLDGALWDSLVLPTVQEQLQDAALEHVSVLIGTQIVTLITSEPHLIEFYRRNWRNVKTQDKLHAVIYVLNDVADVEMVTKLKGAAPATDGQVESFDVCCPQRNAYLVVNGDCYDRVQSRATLGLLEYVAMSKVDLSQTEAFLNDDRLWVPLHGASVRCVRKEQQRCGVLLVGPQGIGKSLQAYALTQADLGYQIVCDDVSFFNPASGTVMATEDGFYSWCTNADVFPELLPIFLNSPLENSAHRDRGEGQSAIPVFAGNPEGRGLIDLYDLLSITAQAKQMCITDVILMRCDFMDKDILKVINAEQMEAAFLARDNVLQYESGKKDGDGYGLPRPSRTESFYNPFLIDSDIDVAQGRVNDIDKVRIVLYRSLLEREGFTCISLNARLSPKQTQFCLRKYLSGHADEITLLKGVEIEEVVLKKLKLEKKPKERIEGRRIIDLVGLYSDGGEEVEVVAFHKEGFLKDAVAFVKEPEGVAQERVVSCLDGDGTVFIEKNRDIGVEELFG